jgi:hypothetical protein
VPSWKEVGVPHPSKSIVTTVKPFELLHMDLFGLVAYISISVKYKIHLRSLQKELKMSLKPRSRK